MRPYGRRRPELDERGSAVLEFHFLGILLLVPLVYVLLAVLDVQRTSYGVTQAAREAARVYAATGDRARAEFAAQVALDDQRVAGLIMALEQSIVMGIALAWLFARMLGESEKEEERAERYA